MDSKRKRELEECVLRILRHGDLKTITESKVRKLAGEETGLDLTDPANRKIVKRVVEEFFVKGQQECVAPVAHEKVHPKVASRKPLAKQSPPKLKRRRNFIDAGEDEDEEEEVKAEPKRPKAQLPARNSRPRIEIVESKHEDGEGHVEKRNIGIESDEEEKSSGSRKIKFPAVGKNEGTLNVMDDEDDEEEEGQSRDKYTKMQPKTQTNEDGDTVICQLSKMRSVAVQDFKGKILVSIREYYEKEGKLLPTRKGISLTVEQWEAFKEGMPDIDAAISRLKE